MTENRCYPSDFADAAASADGAGNGFYLPDNESPQEPETWDDVAAPAQPGDFARFTRWKQPDPTLALGYRDDVPFEHNPLDPHPEIPTPFELVVRLTRKQRERRVERLVEMAQESYREAMTSIADKTVVATCALVSGGNDSYTVARLFRDELTHLVHANTQTGIEATREHVRRVAVEWGLPLIEHTPPAGAGYFDLVLGDVWAVSRKPEMLGQLVRAWPGGFPGPAAHGVMQQRIKGRALAEIPHDFGISGSQTQRVVFIAGRRRAESRRRATVPHYEAKGTIFWSSPIAIWLKADLRAYRLMTGDVPLNPVARKLGMSGECGCLANATAGEVERWRTEYPDEPFIRRVIEVEQILAGPGYEHVPDHRKKWGWGADFVEPDAVVPMGTDSLCSTNCGADLADLMDPLFEMETAAA